MLSNYDREMKFLRERNEARAELVKVWPTEAADVPACIDQWVAQVGDLYGRDSETYRALLKVQAIAEVDLQQINEEAEDDETSDNEEYIAAHAGGRIIEARRLTAEGRR